MLDMEHLKKHTVQKVGIPFRRTHRQINENNNHDYSSAYLLMRAQGAYIGNKIHEDHHKYIQIKKKFILFTHTHTHVHPHPQHSHTSYA